MVDIVLAEISPARPQRSGALRRFLRHRLAILGLATIVLLLVVSAGAHWLAPYDPDEIDIVNRYAMPLSEGHWLGTDDLGRDVLTRLMYAGQISLAVGVAAMVVTVLVGFAVGATSAYLGGWVDIALM